MTYVRRIPAPAVLGMLALWPGVALADDSPYQMTRPFEVAQATTQQQKRSEPVYAPEPQRFSLAVGGLYTHREGETAGWAPNVEANFSPTDRLQLHAMVPYTFDRVTGGTTHFGLGDVEAGVRYRFIDEDPEGLRPAVSFYPLVDFPTGSFSKNLGTGRTHAFLPVWISKSFGNWIPFGGGGYWINPGPNNRDWLFAAVGVVRVINETWSLTGDIFHATSSKIGLRDQTGFDVGARVNLTEAHHVIFTIGRGLQNVAQTNEFTGYLAYILTF